MDACVRASVRRLLVVDWLVGTGSGSRRLTDEEESQETLHCVLCV